MGTFSGALFILHSISFAYLISALFSLVFVYSCILKEWVATINTMFAMYITLANAKKGCRFSSKTKRLFSHITVSTIFKKCCFQKVDIFLAGEGKQDPCLLLS